MYELGVMNECELMNECLQSTMFTGTYKWGSF